MHAAAVAAKLPDRVLRCALLGAHCPNDLAGLDITRGMNHLFRYSARMIRFAPFLADPLAYAMKMMFRLRDTRKASAQITFSSPDYQYIMDWPEHKQTEMTDFFGDIMSESMSRTHFGHSDCGRLAVLQPWYVLCCRLVWCVVWCCMCLIWVFGVMQGILSVRDSLSDADCGSK